MSKNSNLLYKKEHSFELLPHLKLFFWKRWIQTWWSTDQTSEPNFVITCLSKQNNIFINNLSLNRRLQYQGTPCIYRDLNSLWINTKKCRYGKKSEFITSKGKRKQKKSETKAGQRFCTKCYQIQFRWLFLLFINA